VRSIDALKINITRLKSITKIIEFLLDNGPAPLDKVCVETIRTWRFITRKISDNCIYFFSRERFREASKI
jgi:hypothetical protein